MRRIAVPTAFDLVTTVVAEPTQYRGMIAFVPAVGWFVVGLMVVVFVERAAGESHTTTCTPGG